MAGFLVVLFYPSYRCHAKCTHGTGSTDSMDDSRHDGLVRRFRCPRGLKNRSGRVFLTDFQHPAFCDGSREDMRISTLLTIGAAVTLLPTAATQAQSMRLIPPVVATRDDDAATVYVGDRFEGYASGAVTFFADSTAPTGCYGGHCAGPWSDFNPWDGYCTGRCGARLHRWLSGADCADCDAHSSCKPFGLFKRLKCWHTTCSSSCCDGGCCDHGAAHGQVDDVDMPTIPPEALPPRNALPGESAAQKHQLRTLAPSFARQAVHIKSAPHERPARSKLLRR